MSPRFLERMRALYGEVHGEESHFRKAFGVTFTIGLDSFAAICGSSWLATDLATRWQSNESFWIALRATGIVTQFPLRCLWTLIFPIAWICVLAAWLRYLRWPPWWALPYVLWVLCPAAWIGARFAPIFIVPILVLLQLPIVIGSVRRSRDRIRAATGVLRTGEVTDMELLYSSSQTSSDAVRSSCSTPTSAPESSTAAPDGRPASSPRWLAPITRSPVTVTLGIILIANFVALSIASKIWPKIGPMEWGADWGPLTVGGQWWRLVTSTFVHQSWVHLLDDLIPLWFLGKRAEQIFGRWAYFLLYLSCGLAGSIANLVFQPENLSFGASAGILGIAGALLSAYGIRWKSLSRLQLWKLVALALWLVFVVYYGAHHPREISNSSHVVGLLVGLALGAALASKGGGLFQREMVVFSAMAMMLVLGGIFARHYNRYLIPLNSAGKALDRDYTDEGLKTLRTVLDMKPNSFLANSLVGQAYFRKGDYQNAESSVKKALNQEPDHEYSKYLLGMIEVHTNRCPEAHELAQKLITRDPKDEDVQSLSRHVSACLLTQGGDKYLSEGKTDLALEQYQRALQDNPHYYQAEFGLANAYKAKLMFEESQEAYAKAEQMQMIENGLNKVGLGRL